MPSTDPPYTRRALLGTSVAVLGSLAGCPDAIDDDAGRTTAGTRSTTARTVQGTSTQAPALHVAPDPDLYRPIQDAAAAWNRNPAPDAHWEWSSADELDTDAHLADHFAAQRGLAPTAETGRPPVPVAVSLLDPEQRVRGVSDGDPDVFTLGPVRPYDESFLAETLSEGQRARLTSRPLARGGSAFFVSPALASAGVDALTADEIRRIYAEEVENWSAVGGPDREVFAVAGAAGTPDSRIKTTFFGGVELPDQRFGRPRNRYRAVLDRDDAITYLPPGYAASELPALDVVVDGTRYGLADPGYPTTVTHTASAWGSFDAREAAVLDVLRSSVGRAVVATRSDLLPLESTE